MEAGIRRYKKEFEYSYTLGPFPTFELLQSRPDLTEEVVISASFSEAEKMFALCQKVGVPCRYDDKTLSRIASKNTEYAAGKFRKFSETLNKEEPHVMLVSPADMGNLGTIMRTLLALGVHDLAVVEPVADLFNPKTVRASMGALFKMRVHSYPDFESYRAQFPERPLFPFMLDGKKLLTPNYKAPQEAWTLIFGSEASGLPPEYAKVGQSLLIPQSDEVDSLNLAISVALGVYVFKG